jgi:ubiquinol-cytochrome c reductase cytochrome c1 subunit
MKKIVTFLFFISTFSALAAGDAKEPKQINWPFDGFFGVFDRTSAQRGFQVYKEVCSSCHGLYNLSYRNLEALGIPDAEVKAIAAQYNIVDGPNDEGEMFERPAIPSDKFFNPFKNDLAARAANNGAYPIDLSLIIKARHDGANYVYSLLTGYKDAPEGFKLMDGLYYNEYFPGYQLAMAPPLSDGQVEYMDSTRSSVEQMSKDLVVFLQWAAEPEMEQRKEMGLRVAIYLSIFTILFYFSMKRVWANIKK